MARAGPEKAARPSAYGPARCKLETFCCCNNPNVFFKMSISDSEFHYPGELTDEELLQQPTYFLLRVHLA